MSKENKRGSITVVQYDNPKYNPAVMGGNDNHRFVYQVVLVRNTMIVNIAEWLSRSQVETIIADGYTVTIKGT